ncbi:YtxH domain-containing protein [Robertmurraya korlensis]|uniref:YtxH domain-containing protein n=1 Tax=Robertmurraya korlensis TaxID=519977 RepID=UPI00203A8423|nr:YtxH domain-containing protein [Robertmurraya korlensis]MCM3599195.1 YtxH domain-containing protein [Robertmurraya korlensis]
MVNHETEKENRQNVNETSGSKEFLMGAIIGGLVGAATALFLAPKSGKEIRTELNTQAENLKGKTSQLYDVAKTKSTDLAEAAKVKSSSIGQAVSKQSIDIMSKVKLVKPVNDSEADVVYEDDFSPVLSDDKELQRKLEETKRAFDETESQLNH